MANAKLVCALLLCMVLSAPMLNVAAYLGCHAVGASLVQCLHYLQKGGKVPSDCCRGVRLVNNSARTTMDRRLTCNCLKNTAKRAGGVNDRFLAALPGNCKVRIPFRISTSTNCNSIR